MFHLIAVLFVAALIDKNLFVQSATFVIPLSPYNWPIRVRIFSMQQKTTTTTELPVEMPQKNTQASQSVPMICGHSVHKLIQGGQDVAAGEFAWLGALFHRDVKPVFICTVNLVTRKHLLTAAHCLQYNKNPEQYQVVLGARMPNKFLMGISAIAIHPEYDLKAEHDIAVLSLRKDLKFDGSLWPICLHLPTPLGNKNLFGMVAGFGPDYSTYRKVKLPIVSQTDCRDTDHPYFRSVVNENTFCAGSKDQMGPCKGDSGAGFMQEVKGRYYLRGIVSSSANNNGSCDLRYHYIVFANLVNDMDWLNSLIGKYLIENNSL